MLAPGQALRHWLSDLIRSASSPPPSLMTRNPGVRTVTTAMEWASRASGCGCGRCRGAGFWRRAWPGRRRRAHRLPEVAAPWSAGAVRSLDSPDAFWARLRVLPHGAVTGRVCGEPTGTEELLELVD